MVAVQSRLESAIRLFAEFEETRVSYHDTLVDEAEIEARGAWFSDMQTTYVAGVKAAKTWLRTQAAHVDHGKSSSCDQGGFLKFHALAIS